MISGGPMAHVTINAADDAGMRLTVRMHLQDSQGVPVRPVDVQYFGDHVVFTGTATLNLPPGGYRYAIERGPEFTIATGAFELAAGGSLAIHATLARIANLAAEGWWSGDLHIHREPEEVPLLAEAEDLHVAPVITWWNAKTRWSGIEPPAEPLAIYPGERYVHAMAGEDERGGGALLYFNLEHPLPITDAEREAPSPMAFARMAREHPNAHIDIEKPFWWDVPTWLAHGVGDTIGIANNHMCRATMYESEAWGKPRDTQRLPPPRGNGWWTQEIYYHVLNAGLRVAPSAGSAAGVLPNPVGYNRVYVHIDGPLTHEGWWRNLRAGRSFVSNGPLLRVRANGQLPGHVFRNPGPIRIEASLTSRDHVSALELVHNGVVVKTVPAGAPENPFAMDFEPEAPGWFLVRAIADVERTFRFASTAPFYLEDSAEPARISRASCQFFLDWVRERIDGLERDGGDARHEVLRWHREAEAFWQTRLESATAD